ncbi:MAG: NYN domain-containing protein [Gaiellaceae bacterium]
MNSEPTLYLFDGYNLLHAGGFEDVGSLVDTLASFVALQGARGVAVFDGAGRDDRRGPLEIRYAANADALLERLSAEHRSRERICLVSSDAAVRATSGQEVAMLSSQTFLRDLVPAAHAERVRTDVAGRLDAETLTRLERLRRGES